MSETKELTIITDGTNEKTVKTITEGFQPFIEAAKELQKQAPTITVADASDKDGMKKARELRLAAVKNRKAAQNTKDLLKKDAIAYGRAVQANFNMIEEIFKSHESELMHLEKTAERAEEERVKHLIESRTSQLREIDPCIRSDYYALDKMTDEEFTELVENARLAIKKKAEEKAENERIEKEKKEAEEKARLEAEKKRLEEEARIKRENEELQKKLAEEKKKREAEEAKRKEEESKRLEKERVEREKREAEEAKKRAEIEAKLTAEREEKERLQRESEKREAEENARIEKQKADRQALLQGSDKVKLDNYCEALKELLLSNTYEIESEKARTMYQWANNQIEKIREEVLRGIKSL